MKTNTSAAREPLLRIARREDVTLPKSILIRALAILAALVVDALFIFFVTGLNPLSVYVVMFTGTFGNFMRLKWAVEELAKLLLIGIALAPAFNMRFWNIGAEGQVLMGGLATAACMIYFGSSMPTWLLFTTMVVTSVLIGASKPQQILDNIDSLKNITFTQEECDRIDEITAMHPEYRTK